MPHTLFLRFLLVFALLFAQLGGLTHSIAHTLEAQSQDQTLAHNHHCDLCAAYAQIGSAIGSGDVHFDFAATLAENRTTLSESFRSSAFCAFAARAPPYSA